MNKISYRGYGQTDIGLERAKNEDAFTINEAYNFFAIADGLGGLPGGDVASQTAIQVLEEIVKEEAFEGGVDFASIFNKINAVILEKGKSFNSDFGIATTLTAGILDGDVMHIGHVGDTGIFVFKKDSWRKLTIDHTMAQQIRDEAESEEDIHIPDYYNHILTQCIGKSGKLVVETLDYEIEPGDRLLFYSDGVTKAWKTEELHVLSQESVDETAFVKKILEEGNNRGGIDNATAIAIFFD